MVARLLLPALNVAGCSQHSVVGGACRVDAKGCDQAADWCDNGLECDVTSHTCQVPPPVQGPTECSDPSTRTRAARRSRRGLPVGLDRSAVGVPVQCGRQPLGLLPRVLRPRRGLRKPCVEVRLLRSARSHAGISFAHVRARHPLLQFERVAVLLHRERGVFPGRRVSVHVQRRGAGVRVHRLGDPGGGSPVHPCAGRRCAGSLLLRRRRRGRPRRRGDPIAAPQQPRARSLRLVTAPWG